MTKEHKFKPGDIVRQTTGGPTMTVNQFLEAKPLHVDDFDGYVCSWYVGTTHNEAKFQENELVKVPE